MNIGDHVLAIDRQLVGCGSAQRGVENRTILGDIDMFTGIHGVATCGHARLLRKFEQGGEDILIEIVL